MAGQINTSGGGREQGWSRRDDQAAREPGQRGEEAKASNPVTAAAFAEIASMMSRFLSRLSEFSPFRESNVGIAEWSVLNALSKVESGSNKQLVRDLGITKQRVNQICDALKTAGYISVTAAAGDARKGVIVLTAAGRAELEAVNEKLAPLLMNGLAGKERTLTMARKSLKALMHLVNEERGKDEAGNKSGKQQSESRRKPGR
jgi:DNA-binding MarR family transcriptional regulator